MPQAPELQGLGIFGQEVSAKLLDSSIETRRSVYPEHLVMAASDDDIEQYLRDHPEYKVNDHDINKHPTYDDQPEQHIFEQLEEEFLPESIIGLRNDIEDKDGNPTGLENDVVSSFDTLLMDIFPTAGEFLSGNHSWFEYLQFFGWVFNFFFIGIPWALIAIALVVFNIVVNIWLNEWWADGNAFLIYQTVMLCSQALVSIPLIFEIPNFIRNWVFIRSFAWLYAAVHTSLFAIVLVDWLYSLFWAPKPVIENYDAMSLL